MDTTGVIQIAALIVLIFLSGFFSSAETAFSTVNRVRLRTLAEEDNKKAVRVLAILDRYGKMLSAILIGNNIVNLSASSVMTTFVISLWGNKAVGIATGVLTFLVLMFGEIIPKTWAMQRAEAISLLFSPVISLLIFILTPVIFIVDKLSNCILKLLHISSEGNNFSITEKELKTYVDVSHEGGVIESEERALIYNVFDFGDTVAKDIMIPRIRMTTVPLSATYQELLSTFQSCMFTRLPVYDDDPDHIIGIVNIKDFILVKDKEKFSLKKILREAYYTYEYKNVSDLLMEIRERSCSIAFVLSEYGVTVGMITMEDLIEELVGEIRDEYDADEEELIQETEDGQYLVEGTMKLDDINDALETSLDSEDYDSIGGLMLEQLDRLPEDQEVITLENGIILQACGVQDNRVIKVLITLPPEDAAEEPEETTTDS
ncbi:MAG: hemolysin family protein [Bacteroidales bacterium]|nr:hemolysin family protein [Bacteroidales bacterium]MCM1416290.1 hemolysin family protein [bacterium]MCM1424350.1 hemolysin family protein [bacterium]